MAFSVTETSDLLSEDDEKCLLKTSRAQGNFRQFCSFRMKLGVSSNAVFVIKLNIDVTIFIETRFKLLDLGNRKLR